MTSRNIVILIATHKRYPMPKDECYLPIHVGHAGKQDLGYIGDDTGDNISRENKNWCELTALYWGWKNLSCNYMGLVQYRRHFMYHRKYNLFNSILTGKQAEELLQKTDIILPKKRNYYIMTLADHFNGYDFTIDNDLKNLKEIIHELSPDYDKAFEMVMTRKSGHMCNMFLMKKNLVNEFCEWEFPILREFEKRTGAERCRLVGYAAEHMLDIWIEKNNLSFQECNVAFLDRKNEFNRRFDFIMRKLGFNFRRIPLMVFKADDFSKEKKSR